MEYREFTIVKRNGKGVRKITAPDAELLAYQRAKLSSIELIWEQAANDYGIDDIQHGFIKNRNPVTAAIRHLGYSTTISMDISDFFDSVTTEHIREFSPTLADDSRLFHADGYCSQGFASSPMLANIAIIPALKEIDTFLHEEGLVNIHYIPSSMTVYADDVTISIDSEDMNVLKTVIFKVSAVLARHGFKIKVSKTRIRFAKYGFRRILGIMVGESTIKVPRSVKYKMRAAKHQKNGPSLGGLTTWSRLLPPKIYR